jgi:hypothetical protein
MRGLKSPRPRMDPVMTKRVAGPATPKTMACRTGSLGDDSRGRIGGTIGNHAQGDQRMTTMAPISGLVTTLVGRGEGDQGTRASGGGLNTSWVTAHCPSGPSLRVECHQLDDQNGTCSGELLEGRNDIVHGRGEEVRCQTEARRAAAATYATTTMGSGGGSDNVEAESGGYRG